MKKTALYLFLLIILIFTAIIYAKNIINKNNKSNLVTTKNINMQITSKAFENNQNIPKIYTCDGQDINPPLTITEVPGGAKSLVLIADDPDAPAGTWTHWILWNIPAGTKEISENSVPNNSVQGVTSFGKPGYGGPCPPSGTHRYYFKLFALDTSLSLSATAKVNDLTEAMSGHILDQAQLIGLYPY